MSDFRERLCSNLGRAEQTVLATRPAAGSDEVRRMCDSQLSAARRLGCAELGVLREEPGTAAGWYCSDPPEANPIAVPPPPPGASSYERARRSMCAALAGEEFALLQARPAWEDPEARRFCDSRAPLAATWNCGEFGVLSATPGTAAHWYCHSSPDPEAVPAPAQRTQRAFVAAPEAPEAPEAPAPAPAPGQGILLPTAAQATQAAQAEATSPPEAMMTPEAQAAAMMAMGIPSPLGMQTMVNPTAPAPPSYGPYVELSNAQTGVKAFCRMNLDHQVFVCDTPVHGSFQDGQGNAMVCDRATWMCKPAAGR
jgi:hypothetical protein